ncbi:MAG: exodeoxyribonuclease VII small subunit [Desulfotomaculum sp.]|nr:exodeoxyribonuclease VII small subunit [Desulfotomaculum sp.]
MPEKNIKFEEALARLEEVVKQLEDGELPLDQALELFAEGIKMAKLCNEKLENAEKSISTLLEDQDGGLFLKEQQVINGGGQA